MLLNIFICWCTISSERSKVWVILMLLTQDFAIRTALANLSVQCPHKWVHAPWLKGHKGIHVFVRLDGVKVGAGSEISTDLIWDAASKMVAEVWNPNGDSAKLKYQRRCSLGRWENNSKKNSTCFWGRQQSSCWGDNIFTESAPRPIPSISRDVGLCVCVYVCLSYLGSDASRWTRGLWSKGVSAIRYRYY